jgi:hypothetical protein
LREGGGTGQRDSEEGQEGTRSLHGSL